MQRPDYCRINLSMPLLRTFFEDGSDTRPDFRLSRESLAKLMGMTKSDRRHGWGPAIENLVFLFWLASGTSYRVVSRAFGMPRATVHHVVHRVCEEVLAIRSRVILLPKMENLAEVGSGFAGLAGHPAFQKAVGAIDGCHVRIKPPSGPDGQCYRNRKLFLLQAVCDHQGRFIDTYTGWPGSVHDSRVLRNSPLFTKEVYPPPGHACCVLHNICLGVGDVMVPDEEPVEVMPEEDGNVSDTQSGAAWRENLCAHLSALEQADHDHDYC
ncbi:hypothetical protein SKAU_G00156380 [Synaphobranchus kaupii]|uniref:DDE Tnp4 domain-containing protein n=1 Tax=Synaphobranchus kaupii TaxID=118154 RepID=A0A9Q1FHU1_SYNKA|nr:hypothetical protein SKAU_G00156380 [Synaphobranchus kaupii]